MILIRPFSLEVWLALITCVMASLITLAFYGILVEHSSASDLAYNLSGAFLDQTQDGLLKSRSNVVRLVFKQTLQVTLSKFTLITHRILSGFCFICAFFWNQSYKNEMISSLSVPTRPTPLST